MKHNQTISLDLLSKSKPLFSIMMSVLFVLESRSFCQAAINPSRILEATQSKQKRGDGDIDSLSRACLLTAGHVSTVC